MEMTLIPNFLIHRLLIRSIVLPQQDQQQRPYTTLKFGQHQNLLEYIRHFIRFVYLQLIVSKVLLPSLSNVQSLYVSLRSTSAIPCSEMCWLTMLSLQQHWCSSIYQNLVHGIIGCRRQSSWQLQYSCR